MKASTGGGGEARGVLGREGGGGGDGIRPGGGGVESAKGGGRNFGGITSYT